MPWLLLINDPLGLIFCYYEREKSKEILKFKKNEKIKMKTKQRVITLTINSHPDCVSKQVKLMTP